MVGLGEVVIGGGWVGCMVVRMDGEGEGEWGLGFVWGVWEVVGVGVCIWD